MCELFPKWKQLLLSLNFQLCHLEIIYCGEHLLDSQQLDGTHHPQPLKSARGANFNYLTHCWAVK